MRGKHSSFVIWHSRLMAIDTQPLYSDSVRKSKLSVTIKYNTCAGKEKVERRLFQSMGECLWFS